MSLAPNVEDCPMGDKHVTKQWKGPQRHGLSCVKCHKTWEWLNVTTKHSRMKATYDITVHDRSYNNG